MFIGPSVPELCRREDLAATLLRHGVNMMPAGVFVAGRALADHAVRINLACAAALRDGPRGVFNAIQAVV